MYPHKKNKEGLDKGESVWQIAGLHDIFICLQNCCLTNYKLGVKRGGGAIMLKLHAFMNNKRHILHERGKRFLYKINVFDSIIVYDSREDTEAKYLLK
jgi:hypothetical protein